ncbi:MAG: transposase zinc-binding domain-containing protein [Vulcanimicrobiota bacterium]
MSSCAQPPLYRQKEFHQSPLWRLLVDHGENSLKVYDSRYGESHGSLPLQSAKIMEKLLRCGDPRYGLTLPHCPDCQIHMAVPFSCKTRVCPSCINRRAEDLSHSLAEKLPEGEYRHLVVTLPKKMGLRKSLVARKCLQPETAKLLESWPLDRSGFSTIVGDPITQPTDRPGP